MQRCYEKREDRFIELIRPIRENVWDCDSSGDKEGVYYTKEKPLSAAVLGI